MYYYPAEIPHQVTGINVTKNVLGNSPLLTVSWSSPVGSGITYNVWYSKSYGSERGPPSGAMNISGISQQVKTLNNLEVGTTYYIWVTAVKNQVQGPYSARVSEMTCDGKYTC